MIAVVTAVVGLTLIAWGFALVLREEHPYQESDPIALAFALQQSAWGWRRTRPWRSAQYPEASVPMLRYLAGASLSLAHCLKGYLARRPHHRRVTFTRHRSLRKVLMTVRSTWPH